MNSELGIFALIIINVYRRDMHCCYIKSIHQASALPLPIWHVAWERLCSFLFLCRHCLVYKYPEFLDVHVKALWFINREREATYWQHGRYECIHSQGYCEDSLASLRPNMRCITTVWVLITALHTTGLWLVLLLHVAIIIFANIIWR